MARSRIVVCCAAFSRYYTTGGDYSPRSISIDTLAYHRTYLADVDGAWTDASQTCTAARSSVDTAPAALPDGGGLVTERANSELTNVLSAAILGSKTAV